MSTQTATEQKQLISCSIKKIGMYPLPDPDHGDVKLSVFPFKQEKGKLIELPYAFKPWEKVLNGIMKLVPIQEGATEHYVTIDSKFFTKTECLRREGIHADGNFCVDPYFAFATWGGSSWADMKPEIKESWGGVKPEPLKESWGGVRPSWAGMRLKGYEAKPDNSHVQMDWVLPYKNLIIPVGTYISETKGGILTIATAMGCQGWQGTFEGDVKSEGDMEHLKEQFTDDKKVMFQRDTLYFMTSNTPHETLPIQKGMRRTLLRVTLNHNYENKQIQL